MFSNTVKVMLFTSDAQYYIVLDIIKIDWKEVYMTLNGNKVNLPNSVIIPLEINSKLDVLSEENPCFFMLKQGMMWFSLENNNENTISETA